MSGIFKEYKKAGVELKTPVLPLAILFIVIVVGTIGYGMIWSDIESSIWDELYMTIITITTVGYQEIYPMGTAGRIFTMVIAVFGIGSLFYVLSVVMENLFIMQIYNLRGKRKMQKKIDNLENHIIVVGYGRVGKLAAHQLHRSHLDFVVVDEDLEFDEVEEGFLFVRGDATEDAVLQKAGVERARGLIVATAEAATTVFVVLSAKVLNPDAFIVARADEETAIEKLKKAGANDIVNPYEIGGTRLANVMINPNMIEFMETTFQAGEERLSIEKIELPENSKCDDNTLIELDIRKKSGATIVAVIRNGKSFLNPDANFKVNGGDTFVALGTKKQLDKLEKLVNET